ncbi:MAG: ribonuclease P protein component [Pseudomonadota bacterium]|nr:ribonuclease P protein component [Pseudomonadota bacterium]
MPRAASASPRKPFGFPRSHRLLKPDEFRAVFRTGQRVHHRHWMLVVAPGETGAPARLGLAVSKKCAKRAVDRNRIKRVTRDWFRHAGLQGVDIVVTGKRGVAELNKAELRESLHRLQRRFPKP